jgi:hypothetical protein
MKEVIGGFQRNEESLKVMMDQMAAKYHKAETRYEHLRSHAEQKIKE